LREEKEDVKIRPQRNCLAEELTLYIEKKITSLVKAGERKRKREGGQSGLAVSLRYPYLSRQEKKARFFYRKKAYITSPVRRNTSQHGRDYNVERFLGRFLPKRASAPKRKKRGIGACARAFHPSENVCPKRKGRYKEPPRASAYSEGKTC